MFLLTCNYCKKRCGTNYSVEGIITNLTTVNLLEIRHVHKKNLFRHFNCTDFQENVSIKMIHKTDGKDPKKKEHSCKRTFKTCVSLELMFMTVSR